MLLLVHAVRDEVERKALRLVLTWLQVQGATFSTIAWDTGKVIELDLAALGPVHEIEAINRWPLPQRLRRVGLAPLARLLRNRRVRGWWTESGTPDVVLVLGPVRAEMAHYVPPGAGPVVALVGWRPLEGEESMAATAALADHRAGPEDDAEVTIHLGVVPPPTAPGVWTWSPDDRSRRSGRLGVPDDAFVVLGLGPTDWRGAPDLALRALHRVVRAVPDGDVHLVWLGGTPEHPDSHPYHFDVHRLGLDDRVHWLGDAEDQVDLLRRADAVVLVAREPVSIPNERRGPSFHSTAELLRWLPVPMAALDTPANRELGHDGTTWVAYPDTDALAESLLAAVHERDLDPAHRLVRSLPRLFDPEPS